MSLKKFILLFVTAGAVLSGCSKEDALLKEGRDLLKNEEYVEAISFFKGILENEQTNQSALVGLTDAFIGSESYAEALECLDYMTDLETVNQYTEKIYSVYDPLYDAVKDGMELLENEKYEDAITFFEQYLLTNDQNELALGGMVDALMAIEDYEKALDYVAMMTDSTQASEYNQKINEVYHPIDEEVVENFLENFIYFVKEHDPLATSYKVEENTPEAQRYFALTAARQLAKEDGYPDFEAIYSVDEINETLSKFLGDNIKIEEGIDLGPSYITWVNDNTKIQYRAFPTFGGCELVEYTIDTKNSLIKASVIHHHYFTGGLGEEEPYDFGPTPQGVYRQGVYLNNELIGFESCKVNPQGESWYKRTIIGVEYYEDENNLITHQYTFSYDDNSNISLIACEVY